MSSKNVALGRGLGALLRGSEQTVRREFEDRPLAGHIVYVSIDSVSPNPYQPRQDFNDDALAELAESIQELGIIQPITVRVLEKGRFETIAGERRLRAARRVGLRTVPAYVVEADNEAMLEMALVENVQREELNPIEIALGYQRLINECGLRQEQVAKRVGKTRPTVTNYLRLLRLPPRVQAAVRDRLLAVGHARALIAVREEADQLYLLDEILRNDLSVREVERRVSRLRNSSNRRRSRRPTNPLRERHQPQLREFEGILRKRFSTKVHVRQNADGRGKIEVHYFSADDLERVLDLLLQ